MGLYYQLSKIVDENYQSYGNFPTPIISLRNKKKANACWPALQFATLVGEFHNIYCVCSRVSRVPCYSSTDSSVILSVPADREGNATSIWPEPMATDTLRVYRTLIAEEIRDLLSFLALYTYKFLLSLLFEFMFEFIATTNTDCGNKSTRTKPCAS